MSEADVSFVDIKEGEAVYFDVASLPCDKPYKYVCYVMDLIDPDSCLTVGSYTVTLEADGYVDGLDKLPYYMTSGLNRAIRRAYDYMLSDFRKTKIDFDYFNENICLSEIRLSESIHESDVENGIDFADSRYVIDSVIFSSASSIGDEGSEFLDQRCSGQNMISAAIDVIVGVLHETGDIGLMQHLSEEQASAILKEVKLTMPRRI